MKVNKMWIRFRKKYILPKKHKKQRNKRIEELKMRSGAETLKKIDDVTELLRKSERLKIKKDIAYHEATLDTLNWFICQKDKE